MPAHIRRDLSTEQLPEPSLELSSIEYLPGLQFPEDKTDKTDKTDNDQRPLTSEETNTSDEYPTGFRLVVLVGAVVLSVFLISLDQVSCILPIPTRPYLT